MRDRVSETRGAGIHRRRAPARPRASRRAFDRAVGPMTAPHEKRTEQGATTSESAPGQVFAASWVGTLDDRASRAPRSALRTSSRAGACARSKVRQDASPCGGRAKPGGAGVGITASMAARRAPRSWFGMMSPCTSGCASSRPPTSVAMSGVSMAIASRPHSACLRDDCTRGRRHDADRRCPRDGRAEALGRGRVWRDGGEVVPGCHRRAIASRNWGCARSAANASISRSNRFCRSSRPPRQSHTRSARSRVVAGRSPPRGSR